MKKSVMITRKHAVLQGREEQIRTNLLAVSGGRPYIDARLWRAPNESDLSWAGRGALGPAQGLTGRVSRATCINDAGRVANKINQYLFAEATARAGADEEWLRDVTRTGVTIRGLWEQVSTQITAGGWCWVQVDRDAPVIDPVTGGLVARSRLDRERAGDRVRWVVWPAWAVVDWHFEAGGRLGWLLTEEEEYDNSDPFAEPKRQKLRRLWRRDSRGATWQTWRLDGEGEAEVGSGSISTPEVPFALVGVPSVEPWWFDSIESLQAQVMNLDSLHIENLTRTVFGQLVIPASALDSLEARLIERAGQSQGEKLLELVREVVRGLDAPMVESGEDKGITRFIMPSAQDLAAIPGEIERKRRMLFDAAGLVLFNRETRQVQSAESRQFDHLDTEATLRHRALMLQDAERRVVELSLSIDSTFKVYEPGWPDAFDVIDMGESIGGLTEIGNIGRLTLTQRKLVLRGVTRILANMTRVTDEEQTLIDEEIGALTEEDFSFGPVWEFDEKAKDA